MSDENAIGFDENFFRRGQKEYVGRSMFNGAYLDVLNTHKGDAAITKFNEFANNEAYEPAN